MNIREWREIYHPLRNMDRPQLNGTIGFRDYLFDIESVDLIYIEDTCKQKGMNLWLLIRDDGKQQIVNRFCTESVEGYFLTEKKPVGDIVVDET